MNIIINNCSDCAIRFMGRKKKVDTYIDGIKTSVEKIRGIRGIKSATYGQEQTKCL